MSSQSIRSPYPDDENESQFSGIELESPATLSSGIRKFSIASTDSRMSEQSSRSRRLSVMANQVDRARRASRSFSVYQSPYSKLKTKQDAQTAASKDEIKPPPVTVENTYQMEPKKHFPVAAIRQIIIKTLQNGIGEEIYSQVNPGRSCKTLSQLIRDQVKSLDLGRFRVVCVVTIGAKNGESVRVASRCLWDAEFDRFASASVENGTLFAVGTVYGVYFE